MKLPITAVFIAVIASAMLAEVKSQGNKPGGYRFGDTALSTRGILSLVGKPQQYMIVPKERYPAELRGVAVVDILHGVYVARFFEPAGTGAESFFDVCFQIKDGAVFSQMVDNAAGLERDGATVFARSSSYLFDSESKSLLRIQSDRSKCFKVVLSGPVNAMPAARQHSDK